MNTVILKKLKYLFQLISDGNIKDAWAALSRRFNSEELAFGFKRDLKINYAEPRSLMKISSRKYENKDVPFFDEDKNDGRIEEFRTCYVSVNKEEVPCFRLWMIDSSQNDKLFKTWGTNFPQLSEEEVLLEHLYVIKKFRGMAILPNALDQMATISREIGAKYAISFGHVDNHSMSRSFRYAGFEPYILRRRKWFLFKRTRSFEEIPNELMKKYEKITSSYKAKIM